MYVASSLPKVIPVLFAVGTDGVDVEDTLVFGIVVEGMGQPMIRKYIKLIWLHYFDCQMLFINVNTAVYQNKYK